MQWLTSLPPLVCIAAPAGAGAGNPGTRHGPAALKSSLLAQFTHYGQQAKWHQLPAEDASLPRETQVIQMAENITQAVSQVITDQKRPFIIGGDHAIAAGTWSGVANSLSQSLGLLWIDAHTDAHTPATTPSNNWHGMPVAALLGHGDSNLTGLAQKAPALLPQHVCIYGARSYEAAEIDLLQRLGVRIITAEEISQRGLSTTWQEAMNIVAAAPGGFGLSLDVDVICPTEAPGVGSPVAGGLSAADVRRILHGIAYHPYLRGLEIVELNPLEDEKNGSPGQTTTLALSLIEALFSKPNKNIAT